MADRGGGGGCGTLRVGRGVAAAQVCALQRAWLAAQGVLLAAIVGWVKLEADRCRGLALEDRKRRSSQCVKDENGRVGVTGCGLSSVSCTFKSLFPIYDALPGARSILR